MENKNSRRQNQLKLVIYIALSIGFVSAMAMSLKNKIISVKEEGQLIATIPADANTSNTSTDPVQNEKENNSENVNKQREQESKEAFLEAYKVFMHPRCMNCHPKADIPLQGDDSHLHAQGVKRGVDGKGVYALKCKNCHQDENLKGDYLPPGSPGWHLPPANRKMVFEGKTPRQLAMQFKDLNATGFKNFKKDMMHHVETEALVLHSWTYRTPPPLSHAEFVAKVKEWIDKGAAIPDK
jgi:cytochrome c5